MFRTTLIKIQTIFCVHDGLKRTFPYHVNPSQKNIYLLRPLVSRIKDSFENGEIDVIQWNPDERNIANVLT